MLHLRLTSLTKIKIPLPWRRRNSRGRGQPDGKGTWLAGNVRWQREEVAWPAKEVVQQPLQPAGDAGRLPSTPPVPTAYVEVPRGRQYGHATALLAAAWPHPHLIHLHRHDACARPLHRPASSGSLSCAGAPKALVTRPAASLASTMPPLMRSSSCTCTPDAATETDAASKRTVLRPNNAVADPAQPQPTKRGSDPQALSEKRHARWEGAMGT